MTTTCPDLEKFLKHVLGRLHFLYAPLCCTEMYFNIFRSASSSRNRSIEKKKEKVSNNNKLAISCFYLHPSPR